MPLNLTAGTSTDASDVFTGAWSELLIGVRTQLEITVLHSGRLRGLRARRGPRRSDASGVSRSELYPLPARTTGWVPDDDEQAGETGPAAPSERSAARWRRK